jgi:hypothetical protein
VAGGWCGLLQHDRLLAQALPDSRLERRAGRHLIGAIHVDRDPLPARDAKRQHRDQAFGVDAFRAMADTNGRFELLGDIDEHARRAGV